MSSRRRRSPSSSSPPVAAADEQVVADLLSRLQALLPPESGTITDGDTPRAAAVLQEACRYIRRFHREVDGLTDQLSRLLPEPPSEHGVVDGADAAQLVRALLM